MGDLLRLGGQGGVVAHLAFMAEDLARMRFSICIRVDGAPTLDMKRLNTPPNTKPAPPETMVLPAQLSIAACIFKY